MAKWGPVEVQQWAKSRNIDQSIIDEELTHMNGRALLSLKKKSLEELLDELTYPEEHIRVLHSALQTLP